ncbi:MAG: hypothetical protein ABEL76_16750, partial [Bradymonadaceae bacterium]
LRIGGEYFFAGDAQQTALIGGAFSMGWTFLHHSEDGESANYGTFEAQLEVGGGLEMFRTSTVRMLIRGNAVFPLYKSSRWGNNSSLPNDLYTPTFTVSVIGAFGG